MKDAISILENLQPADLDAGLVFSGTPSGRMVRGYAQGSPFVPAVNPRYIFHEYSRDLVVWFIEPTDSRQPPTPTEVPTKQAYIREPYARTSP
jgi:cobaltochelatase CobS